jgi:peptide/nickel transport system ATP-binding protein
MALLETQDLRTHFEIRGNFIDRLLGRGRGTIVAVDGVTISIERGETYGVVGESGSGKTTLGRSILRLIEPSGGIIVFDGTDITALSESEFRPYRQRMQIIFQDPNAALNPAMTVGKAVAHPLRIHGRASGEDARKRATEMLEHVGLLPGERFLDVYPSDLSGGQKQRVVIARALILGPEFIVADEPVSMLDMSVRSKILSLLLDLKREFNLTYLYITHDLATAKFICDRLAILYLGQVIEEGPAESIYREPRHPYTNALLAAIPKPDPRLRASKQIPAGEIPDAAHPPVNCRFHPRCPRAFEPCGFEGRDVIEAIERRWTRLPEEKFLQEKELIGEISQMKAAGYSLLVPTRRRDPKTLLEFLERLREEEPHPAFRVVRSIRQENQSVIVELSPGRDPVPVTVDGVEVACHLFPPEIYPPARRKEAATSQTDG